MLSRRKTVIGAAALGLAAAGGATVWRNARVDAAATRAHPPIGRVLDLPGGASHVYEKGAGRPVVLIHGASGNVRDFDFGFMDLLAAAGFRAIAIDRPGFGHSERGSGAGEDAPWRPAAQARRMRQAARAIGVERALLVGHSLGGASALAWALDAPDDVAGLVLLAAVSHPWSGSAGLSYDVAAAPVIGRAAIAVAKLFLSPASVAADVEGIFAPQDAPNDYVARVGVGLALRAGTVRANAEDIAPLSPLLRAQSARYPELTMPIAALHGDADRIVSADVHSRPLAARAPAAQLTILPGIGHMPHHAAPNRCIEAIQQLSAAV